MNLKLGTRQSLLALAQSGWVARSIERLNPGVTVTLVGIETRGDRIVDIPLRQAEGKEFFVAELDDALREGRVDFCVHSMKDLSLDRPAAFAIGAIPKRENPRDLVIFCKNVEERLARGETLVIGTSSPRRLENIPAFLAKALPHAPGFPVKTKFIEIRGNVNTRLARLLEPEGSERRLDGVVLAVAGLARLHNDETARLELNRLLLGCRTMLLPVSQVPGAPAQGALAVECRADDQTTLAYLRKLHCAETEAQVGRERAVLAQWGGGCHQRFGATCFEVANLGSVLWVRGVHPEGHFVDEIHWQGQSIDNTVAIDPGMQIQTYSSSTFRPYDEEPVAGIAVPAATAWLVNHSRALPHDWVSAAKSRRLYTAGVASWFRLAEQGLWVEGCAEGLGVTAFTSVLKEPLWGLPPLQDWASLTHDGVEAAADVDGGMPVVATYKLKARVVPEDVKKKLAQARFFYWTSASQYDALKAFVPPGARHACGPGKTAGLLQRSGVTADIFPSEAAWSRSQTKDLIL